jgi:hypothetical protein
VRLVVGFWGVHDCRRRGVPVEDAGLLELVETLRLAIGVSKRVEVRTLPGLATAAAVGWRRPVVILPDDWHTWDDTERRAVLAHELAHIRRSDYLAGIVARASLAMYVYHPLLHWMVARLHLQQELAADAEGARLAGGRRAYLRAISRLVLRRDGRPLSWPARTFLPATGNLIRRIDVLSSQVPARDGSLPASRQVLAIVLLVAAGLGTTLVRPSASSRADDLAAASDRGATEVRERSDRFDLACVPNDAMGFAAIRPAALFARPEMTAHRLALNALIRTVVPDGTVKVESIEQATVGIIVSPRNRKKGELGRMMLNGFMIRSAADFDWKGAVKKSLKVVGEPGADLVEVRAEGGVYYLATKTPVLGPELTGGFYFPDARTVVCDSGERLRWLIRQAKNPRPERSRWADWQDADRGVLAVGIDNHDGRWKLDANEPEPKELPVAPALQDVRRWLITVNGFEALTFQATGQCDTAKDGERVVHAVQTLVSHIRDELADWKPTAPNAKAAKSTLVPRLFDALRQTCNAVKVLNTGASVGVSAQCRLPLPDLVAAIVAANAG